jgi:predicted NBD/HSP70 family sugar kinase
VTHPIESPGIDKAAQRALRVTTKALPEHNRIHNRSLVLQTLFHQGAMSRADLARASGLTRPTVSGIVAELTDDGVIADLGLREDSRIGKPATLVDIQADAFHTITLDLSAANHFMGALIDLRGEVTGRRSLPINGAVGEDAFALVLQLVGDLAALATGPLLGIGVGTPGIVDNTGVVREAANRGWINFPLQERLHAQFHLPVYVGNDANAAALAVHTFRETSGLSLMVITIEHGVGAGLIIGGGLVEGEQFSAGEIGHITVDENGPLCSCGRIGCLELAVGAPHLRARLEGLPEAEQEVILRDAGKALGGVLSPIISALNLKEVILSGSTDLIAGPLLESTLATVRHRTMAAVTDGLDMRVTTGDTDLVMLGAAVFVLSAELGVS